MKKCPFCKADIEDNARFCLYCMKPLNEKEVIPPPQRKILWWPFVLAAIFLIALVAVLMLITKENRNLPAESTGVESSSIGLTTGQAEETTAGATQDTQGNDAPHAETPDTNQKPTQNQNTNTQDPTKNTTSETEQTTPTSAPITPTSASQETTQPKETIVETTEPNNATTPEETTAPETPKPQVVYTYRAARAGDDFNANYANSGNDIVITGVFQSAANGIYDIPSYIDGKKVIAIVSNAFSGSNAKTVYVPATVKTIWNYAFAGSNLQDIYFRGTAIYVESYAFPSGITIHCSASCSDRNYRYFKDSASNYGATWAEWNG